MWKGETYNDKNGWAIIRCEDDNLKNYLHDYFLLSSNEVITGFFLYKYKYDPFLLIETFNKIKRIPIFIPNEKKLKTFNKLSQSLLDSIPADLFKLKFSSTRKVIENDMKELWDCFQVKAYKATIVLAGSILEAYLLDWLSEDDDLNYFIDKEKRDFTFIKKMSEKEEMVIKRTIETDQLDLDTLIGIVRYKYRPGLQPPPWEPWESRGADEIRLGRNCIHPKRFLFYSNSDINQLFCLKVYEYLEYLIDYRNKYGKKRENKD